MASNTAAPVRAAIDEEPFPFGLPTPDELHDAIDAIAEAMNALTNVTESVRFVDDFGEHIGSPKFPNGVAVDDAAIGALLRFAINARLDVEALSAQLDEFDKVARSLHHTQNEYRDQTTSSGS